MVNILGGERRRTGDKVTVTRLSFLSLAVRTASDEKLDESLGSRLGHTPPRSSPKGGGGGSGDMSTQEIFIL